MGCQGVFRTAAEWATAIASGEVSATEVLQAHLKQIERHNPTVNAIVTLDAEAALRRAAEADAAQARGERWGPLHGVPVTVKDAFETAGMRTTSSYKPLSSHTPRQDATVVARLRAAGAILLGKTNMAELTADVQSDSPIFGRTNNPWKLARTAGGSSGGSAAAVAAGMVPLDIGSDIAGSIRIPAHFNGVLALKPTEQVVSTAGHIPPLPGRGRGLLRYLLACGPLARSVEDLELALTVLAGADGRHSEVPPIPWLGQRAGPRRGLPALRIAWTDGFAGVPVTASTRQVLHELARRLDAAGCRVEKLNPPWLNLEEAVRTHAEIQATMSFPSSRAADDAPSVIPTGDDWIVEAYVRGTQSNLAQYAEALSRRDAMIAMLERFLSEWDAWLCPVAPVPAFPHMSTRTPAAKMKATLDVDGRQIPYSWTGAYTAPFSLTGHPVVALPLARSEEGLPIGVQVVGRRWQDVELLQVAHALAAVTGPFQTPPGY